MGDIAQFPQNGFGATEKKDPREPGRSLQNGARFTARLALPLGREEPRRSGPDHHEAAWVADRKLAEQMLGYSLRVLTKEAQVTTEEVQFLIDLMRTNAKVSKPVAVEQVVDFSFLERARKDLGLIR